MCADVAGFDSQRLAVGGDGRFEISSKLEHDAPVVVSGGVFRVEPASDAVVRERLVEVFAALERHA